VRQVCPFVQAMAEHHAQMRPDLIGRLAGSQLAVCRLPGRCRVAYLGCHQGGQEGGVVARWGLGAGFQQPRHPCLPLRALYKGEGSFIRLWHAGRLERSTIPIRIPLWGCNTAIPGRSNRGQELPKPMRGLPNVRRGDWLAFWAGIQRATGGWCDDGHHCPWKITL